MRRFSCRRSCARLNVKVNLKMMPYQQVSKRRTSGEHTSSLANIMSPGEPTYFLMANFTRDSFMSHASGNMDDPVVIAALKIAYAENDRDKLEAALQ